MFPRVDVAELSHALLCRTQIRWLAPDAGTHEQRPLFLALPTARYAIRRLLLSQTGIGINSDVTFHNLVQQQARKRICQKATNGPMAKHSS